MSSILVRGLHAPNRCSCCFLAGECLWACTSISRNCPISDFPDTHGRLIDEKDVFSVLDRFIGYLDEDMIERLKIKIAAGTETIVEAREANNG